MIINRINKTIKYPMILTQVAGKIRIKERLSFSDYGLPIAPTQTTINHKHYIEWQIGYDKVVDKKESFCFIGANKKPKIIYELSQIIYEFYKFDIITKKELLEIKKFIENNTDLVENKLEISRTMFKKYEIAKFDFLKSIVSYPLLAYMFNNDFMGEIIIKEKQRAVGIQAMLYFCFPFEIIENENGKCDFIGRNIKSKELGYLNISQKNISVFLTMLKIFGILSRNHKHDICEIINYITKDTK